MLEIKRHDRLLLNKECGWTGPLEENHGGSKLAGLVQTQRGPPALEKRDVFGKSGGVEGS